ncbi:hypothetical protein NX059_009637 [Plenodomus lindquistii]|nr:hypothetical protein NX059_009637 [Plenodomus lindquistii]
MARKLKRKSDVLASSEPSKSSKRQRTAPRRFEQGVDPALLTPLSTARRTERSLEPLPQRSCDTPIPLFEPKTPSQRADILAEDEDEEEPVDATADDDDGPVQYALKAAGAVEEPAAEGSPGAVVAASAAQSSQPQRPESRVEEIDEEPHLH